MADIVAYFITWTTYGTWLPGDKRGWRQRKGGYQQPRRALEAWCRERLNEAPFLLTAEHRKTVMLACFEHSQHRHWFLHAAEARSNHVHIAVTADLKPQATRDQLKANCTRMLHQPPCSLTREKVWTRGGDCEVLYSEDDLVQVVAYINDAQDCDPQLKR